MKESVTPVKEVNAKKSFSPIRSDKSVQHVRNESERRLGSLGDVVDNIRRDGGTPSVESIAMQLSSMQAVQRTPVLLALQQTHGNRYVQRVVSGIQAKMKVGQPGDVYEQEADRVSDQVMHMSVPYPQDACPSGGGCPEYQEEYNSHLHLQTTRGHSDVRGEAEVLPIVHEAIRSPGQALNTGTRNFMEPRFGHDFSQVRVHTDAKARESARAISAAAYTAGRNIVFGAGKFPGKDALTAHELTHVIQQTEGRRHFFSVPAASIQRVFLEVPGSEVGATYERCGNIIKVIMPWSIEEQAILDNVYGALHGAVSRGRRWGSESWVDDFRSSLVSYLSEIHHPSAGHGTMQLTNSQGGSDLSLLLNLVIGERRRVDRVTLLTLGGVVEQAEEPLPSQEESRPTAEPAEIYEEETTTGAEAEESTEELPPESTSEGAYPRDIALFSTFLLRNGYIEQVSRLLPSDWRGMSDRQLTAYLSGRYTAVGLRRRFLDVYGERQAIKARFRRLNIIAALVVGLIWARENIAEGEWDQVALRVGSTGFTAWAFNRILYARDLPAETIMARKAGEFGRWFRGAARTNRIVNFLGRRLAGTLLLWDVSQEFLMSGGGGPDIPFDIIYDVDIDDPSTWRDPDQTMLDMGFNIWYRQSCTPSRDQACRHDIYLGMVEGSLIRTILRFLDITPHEAHQIRDNIYRVQGVITEINLLVLSIPLEQVSEGDNVLVVATGQRSGERVGPRGHYRALEIRPANEAAESLFGSRDNIFIPEYVLHRVEF